MCSCGCNTCETKIRGPLLTEGKEQVKSLLSEGLQYHIDKKIPLFETVYRIGSEKHLALIKEARKMYSRGIIDLCEDDEHIIKTHLGEFGIYEGETVPLDLPILNEVKFFVINLNGRRLAVEEDDLKRLKSGKDIVGNSLTQPGQEEWILYKDNWKIEGQINEAEYQGKDVQLGKPKRGGSKKFYVYVRNPKTKKIKKVSFGAAGGGQNLRVKFKDPKARRAFADRQNCDQKKDRTTPGYWSCNLPRYASILGLGANMNTFW